MQLHDTVVSQANLLKKNRSCLRDFEDQACDTGEALRKYRLYHEEGQKKEEELRSELKGARGKVAKWQRVNLERHNFIENLDLQNRGLQGHIASLIEELSMARESVKASEGRVVDLEEEVKTLYEELSSTRE